MFPLQEPTLEKLIDGLNSLQWKKGLQLWDAIYKFSSKPGNKPIFPPNFGTKWNEASENSPPKKSRADDEGVPKFRCTCYRF